MSVKTASVGNACRSGQYVIRVSFLLRSRADTSCSVGVIAAVCCSALLLLLLIGSCVPSSPHAHDSADRWSRRSGGGLSSCIEAESPSRERIKALAVQCLVASSCLPGCGLSAPPWVFGHACEHFFAPSRSNFSLQHGAHERHGSVLHALVIEGAGGEIRGCSASRPNVPAAQAPIDRHKFARRAHSARRHR